MDYNSNIWDGFQPGGNLTSGMMDYMKQLETTNVGHYTGQGDGAMWGSSPMDHNEFSSPDGRYTFGSTLANWNGDADQNPMSRGWGVSDKYNSGPYGLGYTYNRDTGSYWDEASKPNKGIGEWAPWVAAITGLALGGAGAAAVAGGAGGAAAGAAEGVGGTFGQGLGTWGGTGGASFGLAPEGFGGLTGQAGLAGSTLGGSYIPSTFGAGEGIGFGEGLSGSGGGFNFAPSDFGSGGFTSGLEGSQFGQDFGGNFNNVTGGQSFNLSPSFGEPISTFGGEAIGNLAPFDANTSSLSDLFSKMKFTGKDGLNAIKTISQLNSNNGGRQMSMSDIAPYLFGANGDVQRNKAAGDMLEWMKGQQAKIDGLYAPGSNEYNSLWQQMSRLDAKAGRNSQYGPRSVDLGSRIAQMKAENTRQLTTGLAPAYAAALNQQAAARSAPGVSSQFSPVLNKAGGYGLDYLMRQFGNGGGSGGLVGGGGTWGQALAGTGGAAGYNFQPNIDFGGGGGEGAGLLNNVVDKAPSFNFDVSSWFK